MKFICDDNLGKLAGYLRLLGFDTLFYSEIDDPKLLKLASAEHRILLTRDRKLKSRSNPYGILVLNMDNPLEQLTRVIREVKLTVDTESLFSRCSRCNTLCIDEPKAGLSDRVFPYILKTQNRISRCPSCGRFYWKGSHYKALLHKLKGVIPIENISGEWPD